MARARRLRDLIADHVSECLCFVCGSFCPTPVLADAQVSLCHWSFLSVLVRLIGHSIPGRAWLPPSLARERGAAARRVGRCHFFRAGFAISDGTD